MKALGRGDFRGWAGDFQWLQGAAGTSRVGGGVLREVFAVMRRGRTLLRVVVAEARIASAGLRRGGGLLRVAGARLRGDGCVVPGSAGGLAGGGIARGTVALERRQVFEIRLEIARAAVLGCWDPSQLPRVAWES